MQERHQYRVRDVVWLDTPEAIPARHPVLAPEVLLGCLMLQQSLCVLGTKALSIVVARLVEDAPIGRIVVGDNMARTQRPHRTE